MDAGETEVEITSFKFQAASLFKDNEIIFRVTSLDQLTLIQEMSLGTSIYYFQHYPLLMRPLNGVTLN